MLRVQALHAYYAKSHVLHGVDLEVRAGEIVALLGRNGSGRSTLVKSIMGLVTAHGSVQWHGRELLGLRTYEIAQAGLGYVPENRDIFPSLTVHQNLIMGEQSGRRTVDPGGPSAWTHADMYRLFAQLKERQHTPAGVLSGGEQQMLTLCRTIMGQPQLVMIDEPTEGLAPRIVDQVAQFLLTLRHRGVSVLLVEQKLTIALEVATRVVVMGHGQVVFEGSPAQLKSRIDIRREWLEV